MALYWRPELESTQNYVTSLLGMTGTAVALNWLFWTFVWALVGASIGQSASATVLFFLMPKSRKTRDPVHGRFDYRPRGNGEPYVGPFG